MILLLLTVFISLLLYNNVFIKYLFLIALGMLFNPVTILIVLTLMTFFKGHK
jgi:hypothetical protein